jgi:hypothetical protein
MANITLQNLVDTNISGVSLFDDSENFMIEITNDEVITGGVRVCNILSHAIELTGKMDTCLTICPPQPPIASN